MLESHKDVIKSLHKTIDLQSIVNDTLLTDYGLRELLSFDKADYI